MHFKDGRCGHVHAIQRFESRITNKTKQYNQKKNEEEKLTYNAIFITRLFRYSLSSF